MKKSKTTATPKKKKNALPPQTIVSLEAQNVKKLKAIRIEPDGSMVVIGGKNAQGKSSVLDTIMFALVGGRKLPSKPVRDGEEKATAVVETQDLIIKKTISPGGASTLKVERKDVGATLNKPQSLLDRIASTIGFDPLAFSRKPGKEQGKSLMDLLGLDFSDLNERHREAYEARAVANRIYKDEAAKLGAMSIFDDVDGREEVSVTELMTKMEEIRKHNVSISKKEQRAEQLQREEESITNDIDGEQSAVKAWEQEIRDLKLRIDQSNKRTDVFVYNLKAKRKELADAKSEAEAMEYQDDSAVRAEMGTADEVNNKIRANRAYSAQESDLAEREAAANERDKEVKAVAVEREQRIRGANMPIEGLGISDDGEVTYNGVPLASCSSAEQLTVSASIEIASNPELRVMLIREGSLLDSDAMVLLRNLAEESGFQIWVERVTDDEDGAIIIEDGEVKGEAA